MGQGSCFRGPGHTGMGSWVCGMCQQSPLAQPSPETEDIPCALFPTHQRRLNSLLPDAWGCQAPGCLEVLKMGGRSWHPHPGRAGPGAPQGHCISLYSRAESKVLGEGQSACRHHCVRLLQVALTAPPVCLEEGPRAGKPRGQNQRLSHWKDFQGHSVCSLLALWGRWRPRAAKEATPSPRSQGLMAEETAEAHSQSGAPRKCCACLFWEIFSLPGQGQWREERAGGRPLVRRRLRVPWVLGCYSCGASAGETATIPPLGL